MNSVLTLTPLRAATLMLALTLAGCSSFDNALSGDKLDYRTRASKTNALDVPPDLTQLAREGRYQPQSGVVSASNLKPVGTAPVPPQATTVPSPLSATEK